MKSIPMKTLDPEDKAEILDYREVLVTIAKSPDYDRNGQVRGIDISLVRKGVRILKAIEKASDVLLLEDEDYKHLINKAKSFPWLSPRKISFCSWTISRVQRRQLNEYPIYDTDNP